MYVSVCVCFSVCVWVGVHACLWVRVCVYSCQQFSVGGLQNILNSQKSWCFCHQAQPTKVRKKRENLTHAQRNAWYLSLFSTLRCKTPDIRVELLWTLTNATFRGINIQMVSEYSMLVWTVFNQASDPLSSPIENTVVYFKPLYAAEDNGGVHTHTHTHTVSASLSVQTNTGARNGSIVYTSCSDDRHAVIHDRGDRFTQRLQVQRHHRQCVAVERLHHHITYITHAYDIYI